MTDELSDMFREAITIHIVLHKLQDAIKDKPSLLNLRRSPRRSVIMMLTANLKKVLQKLDNGVVKHQGLARKVWPIWHQLGLASEDLDQI